MTFPLKKGLYRDAGVHLEQYHELFPDEIQPMDLGPDGNPQDMMLKIPWEEEDQEESEPARSTVEQTRSA